MNYYRVDLDNGIMLGAIAEDKQDANEVILRDQGEYIYSIMARIRKISEKQFSRYFYNLG